MSYTFRSIILGAVFLCFYSFSKSQSFSKPDFKPHELDPGKGKMAVADINGDGFNDLIQRGSSNDESLVYYQYNNKSGEFRKFVLMTNVNFRGDRIDLQDIDADGDLDLVTGRGIRDDAGKELSHDVIWVENPLPRGNPTKGKGWTIHTIGNQPGYIKDMAARDFDKDGLLDVVTREHERTAIYFQDAGNRWVKAVELDHESHEGMDVGDLDLDGDTDIVLNGFWYETPEKARTGKYNKHIFDSRWHTTTDGSWRDNNTAIKLADINSDGLPDILISNSELPGYPISMYYAQSREAVSMDRWSEIRIADTFDFCQTLDVADVDNDGDLDILGAKFPRDPSDLNWVNPPPYPVAVFYNVDGKGLQWMEKVIEADGMYAGLFADMDADGDVDILGPRSYYEGPIKWWENTLNDHPLTLDDFSYIQVDDQRDRYVIPGASSWWSYFGLDMYDVNGDEYTDIISGEWFYRNPGGDMTASWDRITFPVEVDAMVALDVDGDAFADVIGQRLPDVYWLEANDREGSSWSYTNIGSMLQTGHANTQDYTKAQLIPGGREEIILGDEKGLHYLIVPEDPSQTPWPKVTISVAGSGHGTGDIDGDGYIDLVGGLRQEGTGEVLAGTRDVRKDNTIVSWWKNPGDQSELWQRYEVGLGTFPDRFRVADINLDGRLDIVTADERYPGNARNAHLTWYEQTGDPKNKEWSKHIIVTSKSMNSLDVADMDRDGDMDIIIGEHEMPGGDGQPLPRDEKVIIFENNGQGVFSPHTVDQGIESHLGTRVCDLDGDGDLDIVSIAWREPEFLHVWRNDAVSKAEKVGLFNNHWERKYRIAFSVDANGVQRIDKPVEIPLNFTSILKKRGLETNLSLSSLKLAEVNALGDIINHKVPFQFDPPEAQDNLDNIQGSLVFVMDGFTPSGQKRHYQLYFDDAEGELPAFKPEVSIEEIGEYEGYPSYKISTKTADYYYHITCAGFASMVDRDGNDWISFHPNEEPDPGSKGRYRGIPNVSPIGYHPGTERDKKPSTILSAGPVRVSLLSVSNDEQWKARYDIYPGYTTMTLLEKGDDPYWILYEGTPGGEFNVNDYWVRSDGTREVMEPYFMPENQWTGHLPSPKWLYFGDQKIDRVLYYVFHEDYGTKYEDVFWHFGEGGMTVFGYGRGPTQENWKQLDVCPAHFTFGFAENSDFNSVAEQINNAYKSLKITIGEIEIKP